MQYSLDDIVTKWHTYSHTLFNVILMLYMVVRRCSKTDLGVRILSQVTEVTNFCLRNIIAEDMAILRKILVLQTCQRTKYTGNYISKC